MYKPTLEASANPYSNFLFPTYHQPQFSTLPQLYGLNRAFDAHVQELNSQLERLKNQNTELTDENKNLKNKIEFLNQQVSEYGKLLISNSSKQPPKAVKLEEKTNHNVKIEPDIHSLHTQAVPSATTRDEIESNGNSVQREECSSHSEDEEDDEAYEPHIVVKPINKEGRRKPRVASVKASKADSPNSEEAKESTRSIAKHVWIQYGRRIKDFALNQPDIDALIKQKIKERRLETKSDYIILFQIKHDDETDEILFKQTYLDKAIDFMDQVKKNDNLFLNSNYRHELLLQREKVEKWIKQCKQIKRYK